MKEVIIRYKKAKTLAALKDLAKYLDYSVSESLPSKKDQEIEGGAVVKGDPSINIESLRAVFKGKNMDAAELRKEAWDREAR